LTGGLEAASRKLALAPVRAGWLTVIDSDQPMHPRRIATCMLAQTTDMLLWRQGGLHNLMVEIGMKGKGHAGNEKKGADGGMHLFAHAQRSG